MIDSDPSAAYYDLAVGADILPGKVKKTYWKYSMGALGQYYAGSMRSLGLIVAREDDPQMFIRTERNPSIKVSGIELSESFSDSISNANQELFIKSVKAGKLWRNDIKQLISSFNLGNVPQNSQERGCYIALMGDKDYPLSLSDTPTYNRQQTLLLLLQFLRDNPEHNWYDLLSNLYQTRTSLSVDESTSFGWYYYQLNEYWQYACNTLLWSVLFLLDKEYEGQAALPEILRDLSDAIIYVLQDIDKELRVDTRLELLLNKEKFSLNEESEDAFLNNMRSCIKDQEPIAGAAIAVALIIKLYHNNWEMLDQLKSFGRKNGALRSGNFVHYMELLHTKGEMDLGQFLQEFIYRNIISRHQFTALRKMGGGQQSSQKFFRRIHYKVLRYCHTSVLDATVADLINYRARPALNYKG